MASTEQSNESGYHHLFTHSTTRPANLSASASPPKTPERVRNLETLLSDFCHDPDPDPHNDSFEAWHKNLEVALNPAPPRKIATSLSSAPRSKKFKHAHPVLARSHSDDKTDVMQTRVGSLTLFLDHPYFAQLLDNLEQNIDILPQSFVRNIFHIDTVSHQTSGIKHRLDPKLLLMQLDHVKCHTATTPRKQRLRTLLEHAFVDDTTASRPVDKSLVSAHSTASDFTGAFNGPGLMLLQDHLIIHNALFPDTAAPPARVHADIIQDTTDAHQPHAAGMTSSSSPTNQKPREYYAKVLPIIQSSGFGKTRTCVQLGTRHPGMLVCLRSTQNHEQHLVSFPPQDPCVYTYFRNVVGSVSVLHSTEGHLKIPETTIEHTAFNQGHLQILAWLNVYCKTLAHYLTELKHSSGCFDERQDGVHDPERCWRTVVYCFAEATSFKQQDFFQVPENLCPHSRLFQRSASLDSVTPAASNTSSSNLLSTSKTAAQTAIESNDKPALVPPPLTGTPDLRNKILDYISTLATTQYDAMLEEYASTLADDNILSGAIGSHLKQSIDTLEQLSPKKAAQTFFFLALDECGSIARILPLIRRLWFHASPRSTWILLIDTNSDLAPLAGTAARAGSRRTSDYDTHRLTQPFSAMPLDVNLDNEERQQLFASESGNNRLRASMQTLNLTLPKLGRPLWNDKKYQTAGLVNPRAILGKLICADKWEWPAKDSSIPPDVLNQTNQNLLSLASRRIPLELTSKAGPTKWYAFVSQQIAHHLRFVGRIYSTSDTIVSSTPSEPPLSAAAAWSFRNQDPETTAARWSLVVQAIVNALAPAGINIGAQGEQGVAVVCSMALDLAVSRRYRFDLCQSVSGSPFMQQQSKYNAVFGLVTVREWLEMLIGKAPHVSMGDLVASSQRRQHTDKSPQDGIPAEMTDWTSRAWLNFKHVVRLPNQIAHGPKTIGPEVLLELWFRHATAQGIVNQSGWDFLIPVYETDNEQAPMGDEIFDKDRLSYVAIQVKNCIQRPDAATLKANVGPTLRIGNSRTKQCLELFIDLKSAATCCVYTRRAPPSLALEQGQGLVRHNMLMGGATLSVLTKLTASARNQAGMLFGNADSLDTLEFDEEHVKYVRNVEDKGEHQQAWRDAQTRVDGALVCITQLPEGGDGDLDIS
ncbi:uncharacterized protein UTRI_06741 [Ustilago trichophora]|uniref:Uncharacterized protein n=1 Tax=Ustilago trichophora TaxID=86804 RepID=A0A5C3EMP9_9BASI|nr:uncharacterized protein UTRI_06741 [Ustilago trichophora]